MQLAFEWTIRVGDLLAFIGGLAIAAGFFYRRGRSEMSVQFLVTDLKGDVSNLEKEVKSLNATMTKFAVIENNVSLLMKWYDELRHGIGLVKEFRGDGVG